MGKSIGRSLICSGVLEFLCDISVFKLCLSLSPLHPECYADMTISYVTVYSQSMKTPQLQADKKLAIEELTDKMELLAASKSKLNAIDVDQLRKRETGIRGKMIQVEAFSVEWNRLKGLEDSLRATREYMLMEIATDDVAELERWMECNDVSALRRELLALFKDLGTKYKSISRQIRNAHISRGIGKKITPEFATEMHGLYDKQWAIELKAVKRCRAVVSGKISAATFFRVAKKLH